MLQQLPDVVGCSCRTSDQFQPLMKLREALQFRLVLAQRIGQPLSIGLCTGTQFVVADHSVNAKLPEIERKPDVL